MSKSPANPDFNDELLSAYVDNELTADERAAVEAHLRTDERAAQLVADLRAASEAVKSLPRVPLARDFRGSVLAAIERRQSAGEITADEQNAPTILTLPEREEERPSRGGARGLVWAGVAIAATLLLMVLRPADEPRNARTVAVSSGEKKVGAAEPADGPKAVSSGAIPSPPAPGGAISSGPIPSGADGYASAPRTEGVIRSSTPSMAAGDARQTAAAPDRGQSAALPSSDLAATTLPPAPAADAPAEMDALKSVDGSTSALALLRTVELTVADEAGVAAFEKALGENKIAFTDGKLPAELSIEQLKEALPATALARFRRARDAVEAVDGAAAAESATTATDLTDAELAEAGLAEAVLVEATAAEIDALIAVLRRNDTAFYFARPAEEQLAAKAEDRGLAGGGAGRGGFGGGGGGFGGARDGSIGDGRRYADGEAPASRAWRLPLVEEQSAAVAQRDAAAAPQSAASQTADAAPTDSVPPAAAPATRSGGRGESNGAATTFAADPDRIRVLFLLHRGAK